MHEFIWLPRFKRNYQKLPLEIRQRTHQTFALMEKDLHHPSLQVKRIRGTINIWEARITHCYRITFSLEGRTIILRTIGEHDVLKNP